MKFNRIISPAAAFLFLGTGVQMYAQHEQEEKRTQPEAQQRKAEPQQRAKQPKEHAQAQPKASQPKPQQEKPAQQAKPQHAQAQPKPQQEQRAQQAIPAAQPKPLQRAQQAKPESPKPLQRVQRTQQPKQNAKQNTQRPQTAQASRPAEQQRSYAPPQRTRQQAQSWQQQNSWQRDGAWQGHSSWQQDRSSNWQSDHRTWAQRGGYGGYYIPEAAFGVSFGIGHWFRIQSQPVIVGGYPRFEYGGYSFMMVDPWPQDWGQDWYANDDVYVGFDNGYYLYNRAYPGEAVAITVML